MYDQVKENVLENFEARDRLMHELSYLSDFALLQSKTTLAESRINRKLTTVRDEKGYELFGLRKMAAEKKRHLKKYIPVPSDPVDSAVAEFTNSRKSGVPFIRETSEMYLYGTRRVQITLD